MKTRTLFVNVLMSFFLILVTTFVHAQVPQLLNYQGKLVKADGKAEDGTFTMVFSIYSTETGGTALWSETQNAVTVSKGIFNVLLNVPGNIFTTSGERFLGIKVGDGAEMTPRFRLTSVPYAQRTAEADGVADNAITNPKIANNAVTSNKIQDGEVKTDDLATNAVTAAKIASGQVVKGINNLKDNVTLTAGSNISITSSGSTLTIAAQGVGTGDITAVNAGNGLTGGSQTADATLHVGQGNGITVSTDAVALNTSYTDSRYVNEGQANSVTSSMITDNTITGSDISSSTSLSVYSLTASNSVKTGTPSTTSGTGDIVADDDLYADDIISAGSSIYGNSASFGSSTRGDGSVYIYESDGTLVTMVATNTAGGGYFELNSGDGSEAIRLTTSGTGSTERGYLAVKDGAGTEQAGVYVNSSGQGIVWGDTKNFRVANPQQPGTEIWYACPEGPEAAAYIRGTATLVNGRGVVNFPDHFSSVANSEGMTVHLTPLSGSSKGLAVIEKSNRGITVVELNNGNGNYDFDYMVMAVRKGHENYKVIRTLSESEALIINKAVKTEKSPPTEEEK